jgi:predicted nucleic acid-binding protein
MAIKVLDSWALLAFFEDQPAADIVRDLLHQAAAGKHHLLLTAVNWGEIFYSTMRGASEEAAQSIADEISTLPIEIIGLSSELNLTKQAAIFKARHHLPYANCFAAALAQLKQGALITGDLSFKPLEKQITIEWLEN